jgi:hypothetical protein
VAHLLTDAVIDGGPSLFPARSARYLPAYDGRVLDLRESPTTSALAWLLVLVLAPVAGVLIYFLFGQDWKAFSRQSKLWMQDLEPNACPPLPTLLSHRHEVIAQLGEKRQPLSPVNDRAEENLAFRNHAAQSRGTLAECRFTRGSSMTSRRHGIPYTCTSPLL